MRKFTLELPLPPIQCSPNKRSHWAVKARAVREYREQCGLIAKTVLMRKRIQTPIQIDMDFYLQRIPFAQLYFPKDVDNAIASTKAAIDSLRDAKVINSDSKKFVSIGTVTLHTRRTEHQGRSALVFTIREINKANPLTETSS